MTTPVTRWVLLTFWIATPAFGVEVIAASVEHRDETYHVTFSVELEAQPEQVWKIVTDFANLARLSPTIVESRLVGRTPEVDDARVEVVLRPCVWIIFCKTVRKVTDASLGSRSVVHITVPELSDFHSAREQMTVEAAARPGRSRVYYEATLVPKFFVPPLVGPYAIRKQILRDLSLTAERVEELARAGEAEK